MIHCADVLAHEVDSVAAANGCVVVPEDIPRKPEPRAQTRRVIVLICRVVAGAAQARHIQLVRAASVDKGVLPTIRELGIEIANMAEIVVERAQQFGAEAQIQRQIRPHLPVILREEPEVVVAVLVIENTASAKAEIRRANNKFLKIRSSARTVHEE